MSGASEWLKKPLQNLLESLTPLESQIPKSEEQEAELQGSSESLHDSDDASSDSENEDDLSPQHQIQNVRGPLIWHTTPSVKNVWFGVYKSIYPVFSEIRHGKKSQPSQEGPTFFFCMIGGGYFAGCIISLSGKVIAHKTFHRYTTRRKQGGAQSSNDAAKGAAHSAGSSLRRYNELALMQEVRQLFVEWKPQINQATLLFVRATGNSNRRALFGPYDNQVLHLNDPRLRSIPFSTRRATQSELTRCFNELTRLKVSEQDPTTPIEPLPSSTASSTSKKSKAPQLSSNKLSEEDQEATLHTGQIQALIRRSRIPALLSYFKSNSLPPDFIFFPTSNQANHHAPTSLHLAASLNSPAVVSALLIRLGVDPTVRNADNKVAFDLAGDRPTRDAFRIARHELGEEKWDWIAAGVPASISRDEAEVKTKKEKESEEEKERLRRQLETARLTEKDSQPSVKKGSLRSAREQREEETKGLSPEMRMRLERERRARAAEARIKAAGGS